MALKFFDSNCMIGRFGVPQPGSYFTVDELIQQIDYFGIDQALVYHSLAKEYSPNFGNKLLLGEIRGHKRLHACWVFLPYHTQEMRPPRVLVEEMRDHNVRAIRLFPGVDFQRFSLSDWSLGELYEVLEQHEVPLFISYDQIDWDRICHICRSFPKLSLILSEVRYEENRHLYPLLERFDNLFIDISWYPVHCGIETICKRFGARRLLFGTKAPTFTPGPALAMINYADISEEEKGQIAAENLIGLLADWKQGDA